MEYRFIGEHTEDTDSKTLEPGEFYDFEDDAFGADSRLGELRDRGLLVAVDAYDEPNATPAAVTAAKEAGVNLREVGGSGSGGQVTKNDVDAFVRSREEGGDTE